MIYFIVVTSLFNDSKAREIQYINGISKLQKVINDLNIENYKTIIIENNGKRKTFLDNFNCDVFYTNNNFLPVRYQGIKELKDIFDCIEHYNIADTDFIVKLTGRYVLHDNSEFMNVIKNLHNTNYECVIKYGSFITPVDYKMNDCITGLTGLLCSYVKQIEFPREDECFEWKWAIAANLVDDKKIHKVDKLGIDICPGSFNTNYFPV